MQRAQKGVTLVELMIVVVIISILGAIAYPSYRNQVIRSARTEGKVALEQRALALEKCFTRYLAYNSANCPAAQPAANGNTPNGKYSVAISNATATTFTLTATPQGGQVNDTQCGNLLIDQTGSRTVSVTGNNTVCW